jgi:aryl-alcohol dehydrogenase-like predicted oxidoreductase
MPWGILEGGILTGKYLGEAVKGKTRMDPAQVRLTERQTRIVKEVQAVAHETGRSMAQVALNWVRQQRSKAQIIPILGARTADQLKDNLDILSWSLTETQLDRLDKVSQMDPGFPQDLLPGNPYLFGTTFDQIDNHHV